MEIKRYNAALGHYGEPTHDLDTDGDWCLYEDVEAYLTPRPISTAPKDGTKILLYVKDGFTGLDWFIGDWEPDEYSKNPRPYWHWSDLAGRNACRAKQPTHWLPLPPEVKR